MSKETRLDALQLDLKNLARTARAIALQDPDFAAPYRLPDNPSEAATLTHADAVLLLLEDQPTDDGPTRDARIARRAKFAAYELPADFVAHLRADRDAITDATRHNQAEVQDGVGNTELVGRHLAAAALDVQELDAIMHNKYARQPEVLRAWLSASRVERAPQREPKPEPPAPGPATP